MEGRIIKGISGFYYVEIMESGVFESKAKGIFRKEGIKPLVGDMVKIEVLDPENKKANIVHILPRKNEIYRPAVANIDQVLLIFALAQPVPNPGVLDRFLLQMELRKLPVIICFNKKDLVDDAFADDLIRIYSSAGYKAMALSTLKDEDVEEVSKLLKGKVTAVAGPSGVGKSSLINRLVPNAAQETSEISYKLRKGKNTTRHTELMAVEQGTYICDTPGFTSFETENIEKERLKELFPEFRPYDGKCRFLGCNHVGEPECRVKAAVTSGEITKMRYASYLQLFEELKEYERNRYSRHKPVCEK